MEKYIEKVLLSEQQLKARIHELGEELSREYVDKDPIFVGVLKGVVVFYADMVREITIPCQFDFMWISSYSGTESTGQMDVKRDLSADIKGRHVLILEDILDSGRTLKQIKEILEQREPASIKICTMLDKPSGRKETLEADYVCFTIPDGFVVGMGLDYQDYYRNLPFVGILKESVYKD